MDVILLENNRNLGKIGQRINVKNGYARNYLIPQGKALPATADSIALFETRRAELEAKSAAQLAAAQDRANLINAKEFTIATQASDEGKLYGSVGTVEISKAINEAIPEAAIAKSDVALPEGAIHSTGEFDIEVHLHSDVIATIKLIITQA